MALVWRAELAEGAAHAGALGRRLAAEGGWKTVDTGACRQLWVSGADAPIHILAGRAGVVLGELFPMPGSAATSSALAEGADCERLARHLSQGWWGRYVALLGGGAGGASAVFRDPSGQVPCLTWRLQGGLDVVASDLQSTPRWLWPPRLSLNWDHISDFLAVPTAFASRPLFDGLDAPGPGELLELGPKRGRRSLIWSPAQAVAPEAGDVAQAGAELVRRVDVCTSALVGAHERVLMELSGGLDSAIIAGALGASGLAPRVTQWLNRVGDRPQGDERAFALTVTDRLGVDLTTVAKPLTPLTEAGLAELACSAWPAINGCDASRDRDEVERLVSTGATAIISGQGGDAVFYQSPTAMVAADEFRRRGLRTLASPVLANVARRTRQSVWGVLAEVAAEARGRRTLASPPSLVAQERRRAAGAYLHPWVADARSKGVAPGKLVQIAALAGAQILHGDSRRSQHADLIYPLLAQPVVECGLAIAAPDLAGGAFDRVFVRDAFAERLPEQIRRRRSKGDLNSYFARLVAGSLEMLRPFLLEGSLCASGVLDRRALEAALTPDRLIWTAGGGPILWAAAAESWVRGWQGRVPDSAQAPRRRS